MSAPPSNGKHPPRIAAWKAKDRSANAARELNESAESKSRLAHKVNCQEVSDLPNFVRDLLSSPPVRGGGLNTWLFRVARLLHAFRNAVEIEHLLTAATYGQPVKRGEIQRAIERSAPVAWRPGQPILVRQSSWPAVDAGKREAITRTGLGLVDLWEASPIRFGNDCSNAEEVIDALFPGNPLLCVGRSKFSFATRPREEWRGQLANMSLIVPSPMTAVVGLTQDGRESEHSLDNTGPRCFLVIEQDTGTTDEQAAVLLHLAEKAPLVVAVHSGGKSIHGWFMALGQQEEFLRRFMRYAVSLGADPATWTRSQFVRLPDGSRENGERQTVYFFNPACVEETR